MITRRCIVALLLLLTAIHAHAGKKIKILFLGNSLTYVNDLPAIVAAMAQSTGDTLIYDSYAPGGYRFIDHGFDANTAIKVKSARWDYVVLQEQSRMPSRETNYYFNTSYTWARNLDTLIQNHDPCAKTLYYMTWGYKDGDTTYCSMYPSWPYVCTYQGMDSLINLRYRYYADTALALSETGWTPIIGHRNAHVSPAGAVWRYLRTHHPSIELYWPDGVHPSEAGSYAAACAFYTVLFRKDPALLPYNYTLSATDAANIHAAARAIVYDSMAKWKVGIDDLRAQFTHATSGNTITCTNTSTDASGYVWDFGDGSSTTMVHASHSYAGSGTYTVRLIATDAGCSDTSYSIVTIAASGIQNYGSDRQAITLSPNPAQTLLNVHTGISSNYHITIRDITGRTIYNRSNCTNSNEAVDVSLFHTGIYQVTITSDGGATFHSRFLKE